MARSDSTVRSHHCVVKRRGLTTGRPPSRGPTTTGAISWLIEPRAWSYVRATVTLDPGSFADIVLHQWVQTMVRHEREEAAGRAARTRILRLGAATLGLLMLVSPAGIGRGRRGRRRDRRRRAHGGHRARRDRRRNPVAAPGARRHWLRGIGRIGFLAEQMRLNEEIRRRTDVVGIFPTGRR
jgi:hypothetical protein